jgi:hypothetical protein
MAGEAPDANRPAAAARIAVYFLLGDTTTSPANLPSCECARYTVPSSVTTPLRAPSWVSTTLVRLYVQDVAQIR